jgi:hypothetical protein
MTTEWLALWCPFLIFGSLTVVFCMIAWKEIGVLLVPITQGASRMSTGARETTKQRRRLLRIALMTSVCLLLNTIVTLSVSLKLDEWSRTADILLDCSLKETNLSKDWEVYGFNAKDFVSVCSAEEETRGSCDCQWDPSYDQTHLNCEKEEPPVFRLPCNCPCSSFVTVERPSVGILTLAHVSQSLVVAIVGLNLGFRKKNLDIWEAFFRRWALIPGSTSVAAEGSKQDKYKFDFDSKAYD